MNERKLSYISSSPHVRDHSSTGHVMYDVILALVPATMFGIWHFGLHAALILAMSIVTACLTEFVFDWVCGKHNTLTDGSAIVTGLLLGLSLSPSVPLYIPMIGAMFAILFVKCVFGGLGKNFMNPALAARCFLLISFGTAMTKFAVDGMSSATPLAQLASGESVNILKVFMGYSTSVIGGSAVCLLLGGLYLLMANVISWQVPVSFIGVFALAELIFGGEGFSASFVLLQIFSGGIMMGALFMATDPVTNPMTRSGQLIFGGLIGLLCAIFRIKGSSADSVSYAIIIGNMLVPLIDRLPVPKPFGFGIQGNQKDAGQGPKIKIPRSAVILMVITLVAGIALGGVNFITRDRIAEQEAAQKAQAYLEVLPGTEKFAANDTINKAIDALGEDVYGGGSFGKAYINEGFEGQDASGATTGYAFSVSTMDGFDGEVTLSVGISADGTVQGIAFTTLNETAGMGMKVDEADWKAQFAGVNTDAFVLNKAGGSTADNEIDSVSGASTTSGAVVNAVNAALDFYAKNLK